MKNLTFRALSAFLIAAAVNTPARHAAAEGVISKSDSPVMVSESEAPGSCATTIKECFIQKGLERSGCFYRAAQNPKCEDTDLGRLVMRRWAMSPARDASLEAAPAFLGPQLVDQDCLANFDNHWLGLIVKGDPSEEDLRQLGTALASCRKEPPSIDFTRP